MTALAYQTAYRSREPAARGDFTLSLMQIALGIAAERYMILDMSDTDTDRPPRVLASNWMFDTIDIIGIRTIAALARAAATRPGEAPCPLRMKGGSPLGDGIAGDEAAAFARFGHGEIYCLCLHAGRRRSFALFSSASPGRIRREHVAAAQFRCSYLLSEASDDEAGRADADPLSERERECLFWAAEGKTTGETATILGVSNHTVNRYVAHAMQKLSAKNRAKAVAAAIRQGIL